MLEPGTILGAKYRLESEIGRGGMGAVWRATRLDLDTQLAVKVLSGEALSKPGGLERFTREAKAAASLSSPHVVRIVDFGADTAGGVAFMAMELLEGESLSGRLASGRPLGAAKVSSIITQVARALGQAHAAGIVHRDLKPANIFLVKNADDELVKLLDFGIAKASDGLSTATGSVLGTPYYMSPEQVNCAKDIDHRTDLWSLGVIACECLTLRRPFAAETLSELAMRIALGRADTPSSLGAVPAGFDEWFARATAVDRAKRFQSAAELASTLANVAGQTSGASAPADGVLGLAATLRAADTRVLDSRLSTTSSGSTTMPPLAELAGQKASPRRSAALGIAVFALLFAGGLYAVLTRESTPLNAESPLEAAAREEGVGAAASGAVAEPRGPAMAAPPPAAIAPNAGVTPPPAAAPAAAAAPAVPEPVAAPGYPAEKAENEPAPVERGARERTPESAPPSAPARTRQPKPRAAASAPVPPRERARPPEPAARPANPERADPLDAYDLQ